MIKLLTILFALNSNSAPNYENGYVVLNSGDTLRGSINLKDRSYTPDNIEYRHNKSTQKQIFGVNDCIAFGLENGINYRRIRTSLLRTREYDYNPKLEFVSDTVVFMEVVRNQRYSLFEFTEIGERPRFFISVEGGPTKQLIYYSIYKETKLIHNREYLRMLADISGNFDNLKLSYKRLDFEKLFDEFNGVVQPKRTSNQPNIIVQSIIGIVNYTPFVINRFSNGLEISRFKSNLKPVIGFNLSFPFSKKFNTFSFDFSCLFSPYTGIKESGDSYMSVKKIHTNNIYTALGLRYMFYKPKNIRPFLGFGVGVNEPFKSYVVRPNGIKEKLPIRPQNGEFEFNIHPARAYFKVGLKLNRRLETEIRMDKILKYNLRTDSSSPMTMYGLNFNWRIN